jgi:gas vesicle protein
MNTYIDGVRDALSRVGLIRSSGPSFMAGLAIGAGVGLLAGAAVALLVTPANGQEMREQLGTGAKKLAAKTQGAISDVAQTVKGKIGGVEDRYIGRNEVPMG